LTDNAAPQTALGAAKGESTFQITVDSESIKTIAHFIQIPTQILDDIPALTDYVNARMQFMLDQEEEDQLLYGNDTGQNLNGLMTQATAFDTSLLTEFGVSASGDTDIDILRAAIAQCQAAQFPPTAIVLGVYNWAAIELAKDAEYRYILANPFNLAQPRLWGLPVVATTAMTSPDFLVGAFNLGAAIWDRQQSSLAISTEDSDNFQKNLATVRAEKRMTLTVYRPASFVEGNFLNTIT
jgi:HK97 family phage major capsid protein